VFVAAFFSMVGFGAIKAILLFLAIPSSMAKSKAFEASGNGDDVFNFTHAPLKFNFVVSE
jgi:hypothetical protein